MGNAPEPPRTGAPRPTAAAPLAHRLRPGRLEDLHGQEAAFRRHPFLLAGPLPSTVLRGPPGCGKTTLARLLARRHGLALRVVQAATEGVGELKRAVQEAGAGRAPPAVLIDEIHRFNRAQQDALLPWVERGAFVLLGATTENPRLLSPPLLSRVRVVELRALDPEAMGRVIDRALGELGLALPDDARELLVLLAGGDARRALGALEALAARAGPDGRPPGRREVLDAMEGSARHHDRAGARHHDVASAFIKSVRGSDPDSALLWLAAMLDGGEDPLFIARRLVVLASEDVGNADPQALTLATSALLATERIGMPEARIVLAQAATYLAGTVKSNASYKGVEEALRYVRERPDVHVPTHLRNTHPDRRLYRYPHDFPGHWVPQEHAPEKVGFYRPMGQGREKALGDLARARRESLDSRESKKPAPPGPRGPARAP